jgi:hypothetical protein
MEVPMSDVFVEVDAVGNEVVAAFLARHSISEAESLNHGQLCADKKRRDVWRIKSSYVKRFEHEVRQYPHGQFVFYVRQTPDAPLSKVSAQKKRRPAVRKNSHSLGATPRQ